MTDTTSETPATARKTCARRPARRTVAIAAIALAAGLAGAFATNAISHARGGHHGFHGGPMGFNIMGGPIDADKAQRHAGRTAERFARRIDATGEQQSKLISIAEAAAKDIAPLRQKAQDARKESIKLLGAATVDRAALEKLRADQIANMDQLSKRISTAMADAADVLTPEQRQKVAERMEKKRDGRGWGKHWGRGGPHGEGPDRGGERGPAGGDAPAPKDKAE